VPDRPNASVSSAGPSTSNSPTRRPAPLFPQESRARALPPSASGQSGFNKFDGRGNPHQSTLADRMKKVLFREDAYQVRELARAATMINDNRLLSELKSCPALKRPLCQIYWAFAIETGPMRSGSSSTPPIKIGGPALKAQPDQFWNEREVEKQLGPIGEALLGGLRTRLELGSFGAWPFEAQSSQRNSHRGITIVPSSTADQVLNAAARMHADLLLAAHIEVKPTAGRRATATLTLRIVDVLNGKELWKSSPISSTAFAAKDQEGDLGVQLVADTFAYIDGNIRLTPLPDIKTEVARKRLAKLSDKQSPDILAALIELRYYQAKSVLPANEVKEAYEKLLNPQAAEQLAGDDETERVAAISLLLPPE
jgi:hypothetical protein